MTNALRSLQNIIVITAGVDDDTAIVIRKSRDYVHGKCQYKVLSIKKIYESKLIVIVFSILPPSFKIW